MRASIQMPRRMPSKIMKSPSGLLDRTGEPVSYFLYPSPRWDLKSYKRRYFLSSDMKTNVSGYDRWELLNYSRQLRAQINELSTAIEQKNSWAFGDAWDAHYCGSNPKWGQEAEEFLNYQFYPACNLRGPLYHFKKSLELSGQAWDVDGDDVMVLTESESHFPMIAIYPATRIGSTGTWPSGPGIGGDGSTVQGGPFDGARIFDGIIFDRNSRMIGVRIMNTEGEGYQDVSSFSADLIYEASWADQGRGIPKIATGLLRWMRKQDIDDFIARGIQRASAVGLIHKTEEGEAAVGNEVITSEDDTPVDPADSQVAPSSAPKVYFEEIEGGEAYYVNSTTGEGIEGLDYRNPHPNTENFVARLERGCLSSIGWFYELLNPQSTGRVPRMVCDMANQSIWSRQSTGMLRARRAVVYAIAKAMKHGFISRNDDGMDPYCWEFGLPKQMSVDAGNDEQADRENLKMGTTSKAILAQKKGFHRKEILKHRRDEIIDNAFTAAEIEGETKGKVSFEKAMELLEQRAPNPQVLPGRGNEVQSPKPKMQSS
jgi:hypothetical protein